MYVRTRGQENTTGGSHQISLQIPEEWRSEYLLQSNYLTINEWGWVSYEELWRYNSPGIPLNSPRIPPQRQTPLSLTAWLLRGAPFSKVLTINGLGNLLLWYIARSWHIIISELLNNKNRDLMQQNFPLKLGYSYKNMVHLTLSLPECLVKSVRWL